MCRPIRFWSRSAPFIDLTRKLIMSIFEEDNILNKKKLNIFKMKNNPTLHKTQTLKKDVFVNAALRTTQPYEHVSQFIKRIEYRW